MNSDWMMPIEIHAWLYENIKEGSTILEFGSGHGSIELAKRYDLISIEHDKQWIGISESRYVHALITDNPASEEHNQEGWYETTPITEVVQEKTITVFIVDGPPGEIGRHGILSITDSLPKDAVFIIDDIHRSAESDLFQKLSQWHGGEGEIYTSAYESGKERKWGVLLPYSVGGSE